MQTTAAKAGAAICKPLSPLAHDFMFTSRRRRTLAPGPKYLRVELTTATTESTSESHRVATSGCISCRHLTSNGFGWADERLRPLGPAQEVDGYELCGCCDGLSPGLDGHEQIVHCPLCHDRHVVTVAAADRWRKEMAERRGR